MTIVCFIYYHALKVDHGQRIVENGSVIKIKKRNIIQYFIYQL